MKNEDIHKGFSETEVRDFLAQQLQDAILKWGGPSDLLETKIKELQEQLRYSKKVEGIHEMFKSKNWEDWDLSNAIFYKPEIYFPFVGTEKEFRELEKQLEKEEEEQ